MIWTVSNVVVQIRCSIIWHLDINFNKVWYRIWKRTPGLDKINATFCTIPLRRTKSSEGVCTRTHTLRYHTENYPFTALKSLFLSPLNRLHRVIFLFIKKVWAVIRWSISDKIPRSANLREIFYTIGIFFHRVENKSTINQNQCW